MRRNVNVSRSAIEDTYNKIANTNRWDDTPFVLVHQFDSYRNDVFKITIKDNNNPAKLTGFDEEIILDANTVSGIFLTHRAGGITKEQAINMFYNAAKRYAYSHSASGIGNDIF